MPSSDKTKYLRLSKFEEGDDPSWYDDYNGDMLKIDEFANATWMDLDKAKAQLVDVNTSLVTVENGLSTAKKELGTVRTGLDTHRGDKGNPHGVTAQQVGAADAAALSALSASLAAHTADKGNPHSVKAGQAGTYTKAEIDALLAGKANTVLNWHPLVLWEDYTSSRGTPMYCLDDYGYLCFKGGVQKRPAADIVPRNAFASLPIGFRPSQDVYLAISCYRISGGIQYHEGASMLIDPLGRMILGEPVNNNGRFVGGAVSLNGIRFKLEAP